MTNRVEVSGTYKAEALEVGEILRPTVKITIPEFAEKHVLGYDIKLGHLLVKPAEDITSRLYNQLIYVGPVRSAKSYTLIDCCIAYTQMVDPIDMGVFLPSERIASYFSKKRFSLELCGAVKGLKDKIKPGTSHNTVYEKFFRAGNILNYGWPSNNQAASREFARAIVSDLDRMQGNIGGEGNFFDQVAKRIRTFGSRGIVVAESSPGKPVNDAEYKTDNLHEAPYTTGILGLYNQGNRQIVYSKCPHCLEYFSPSPSPEAAFIPTDGNRMERAAKSFLICQTCGAEIGHEHEKEFKRSGTWVGEGQTIDDDGVVHGELIAGNIASYWQSGWFAAFQSWHDLIIEYIDALDMFEKTGEEGRLQTAVNTNFASPYIEMARRRDDSATDTLKDRAEPSERFIVQEGVRVLLASVDVQGGKKSRFVVQVMGYGVKGERWLVDRYVISYTEDDQPIRPASVIEHWDYITSKVVNSTYKLPEGDELRVYRVAVDSGGEPGVTERAYAWWRGLKKLNLSSRVWLVKGGSATNANAPTIKKTYPDSSERKDRYSGGRGDVPVLILNTLLLKDMVKSSMDREEVGPSYFHFPNWVKDWFYAELTAERRMPTKWVQVGKRNEAFDLCVYSHALWVELKGHMINWDTPPLWAQTWDLNSEVMSKDDRRGMKKKKVTVSRKTRFRFN